MLGALAQTYAAAYRFPEALEVFDRVLTFAPDAHFWRFQRALSRFAATGDPSNLRAATDSTKARSGDRDYSDWRSWSRYLDRDFHGIIALIEESDWDDQSWPPSLHLGYAYHALGDAARAGNHFEAARFVYEERLRENPEDPEVHMSLGQIYAHLGRGDEALRHGRLAVELLPPSRDLFEGTGMVERLAHIHAVLGNPADAVRQLERIVGQPAGPTAYELRADPWFDPLRDHPRFQRVLEQAWP